MTNNPSNNVKSGVITCSLSDHDMVYTIRRIKQKRSKSVVSKLVRSFRNVNWTDMDRTLKNAPWWCLELSPHLDQSFSAFESIVTYIMDKFVPVKKIRSKQFAPVWLTSEYKLLQQASNALRKKAQISGDDNNWSAFRSLRNNVNLK